MHLDFNNFLEEVKYEVELEGEETLHKITDIGHKKIKQAMDEIDADLPMFERAGYRLHSLEIELGVAPKLIPHFRVEHLISQEEQHALLEEVKHKHLLRLTLSSLFKAGYLKEVLKIGDLEFHGLKIELAAIPKVHLLFWK